DLVDHADRDDPADQRCLTRPTFEQRHGHHRAFYARLLEGALHHLELVGALAQPSQLRLQAGIELPNTARALSRKAEALQRLQPLRAQRLLLGILCVGAHDDQETLPGAGGERAIKRSQSLLANLVEAFLQPFELRLRPKLEGDEGLCAGPNAMA